MRVVDADYLEGERRLAQAVMRGDAAAVHDGLAAPRLPARTRTSSTRSACSASSGWRPVVPGAGLPPPHPGLRRRGHRGGLIAALAVLRADAPADDPAAGVAHPPHGRASCSPRSATSARAPTGTPSARSTGATRHPAPPWESRTPNSGADSVRASACSPPPSPQSPCCPASLTPPVADVKQDTKVPILLPRRSRRRRPELYGEGEGEARPLQIAVSTVKDCSANACSVASFSAMKGIAVYGDRKVTLAKGRKGRYIPLELRRFVLAAVDRVEGARRLYEISMDAKPARSSSGWRTRRSGRDRGKARLPPRRAPRRAAPGTARRPRRGATIT